MSVLALLAELEQAGCRLWEDGGRLRYRAPAGVMTTERLAVLREHREEVLARLRTTGRAGGLLPDEAARHEPFPLTGVQQAYLLGRREAFAYGGVGCHGYGELALGGVEPARVGEAWRALVERHGSLRTVIDPAGSQRVLPSVPRYDVEVVDLRGPGEAAGLRRLRDEYGHRVYDPARWPLFGVCVTRRRDGTYLHLSLDLLVADLASTELLFDELHRLLAGEALEPIEVSFRDYVLAAAALRTGPRFERDAAYWRARLDDLPPAPELPLQAAGEARPRFRRWASTLPAGAWAALREEARRRGLTPAAAVLAAYAEVLGRWSRNQAFTLNLTLQHRLPLHPGVQRLVGDFTSVGLLAAGGGPAGAFAARAAALQARLWEDLDHRLYTGLDCMRELARRREPASALFPVVFTSAIEPGPAAGQAGGLADLRYGITQTPQVTLDCQVMQRRGALACNWDVREGVFPPGLVEAAFGAFERLLRELAAGPQAWERAEPVALPPDQVAGRVAANATAAPLPAHRLEDPVVAAAYRRPDRVAVVAGGRELSRAELLGRALAVAGALAGRGVRAGQVVGVVAEKGWEQPVAALGTLLAGAAYLPLDRDQPPARRDALLATAGAAAVLTQQRLLGDRALALGREAVPVDALAPLPLPPEPPAPGRPAGALAYVMATSGSTGAPKGVMVSHAAAANTIVDVTRRYGVGEADVVLGVASLGFDLSVYDVFGVLAAGGTLVLPEERRRADPSHWASLVAGHGVTVWNSVPAQLQMLRDYLATLSAPAVGTQGTLRLALLSGDWIPLALPDQVRALLPGLRVVSLGGATEAAIWSIHHPVGEVAPEWRSIPYGRPLANQSFHVLDARLRACPDLVAGELYIGGAGVALGYLADPARTAERFVPHPVTGERLYRTGDVGRYLPGGEIEFLGREDRQVKVRGHRIELAEVEEALRSHPAVAAAAALADGEREQRRLVAAVEPGTAREPVPDLPGGLAERVGRAAGAVARGLDGEAAARARSALDDAASLALLRALEALGAGPPWDPTGLAAATEPWARPLLGRWVRALAARGYLHQVPGGLAPARQADEAAAALAWDRAEALAAGLEAPEALAYFRACAERLPALVRGEADPLGLLYPEGRLERARAVYAGGLAGRWLDGALAATVRAAAGAGGAGPLRVLEVGGGTASTTAAVLSALEGTVEVEYLFTELSPLFLDAARERLGQRRGLGFALFDLEGGEASRSVRPNAWDVVLADRVLHATADVDACLRRLRELLAPGGWLVLGEVTREHPATLLSLEVLLARAAGTGRERPFLQPQQWRDALARAGVDVALDLDGGVPAVREAGLRVLAGRVKLDRARLDVADLLAHAGTRVPEFMLPSEVLVVDALPLTSNGKVDRKRLAALVPARAGEGGAGAGAAASTDLQRRVAALVAEVLGLAAVPPDRSFLELGGDSLLAARLAGRLREALPEASGTYFDDVLRALLEGASVVTLSAAVEGVARASPPAAGGERRSPLVELGGSGEGAAVVLVHDGGGTLACYGALASQLAPRAAVAGLVVPDPAAYLDGDAATLVGREADACADALIDAAWLSVHLVGAGAGGVLAVEVARRLHEAGAAVHSLTVVAGGVLEGGGDPDCERHTDAAAAAHAPAPYAGDLTLLAGGDGAAGGWRDVVLGKVEVVPPGDDPLATLARLLGAGDGR